MAIIKDLDNSTTVVVNEHKNLWWSGLLFLIQTEAAKTLLNVHLAAIKKVHASKDNFWSTNSLDIDCFRGQMPSEKKNHRKSMHRKHIVLMIMTPWSAKITVICSKRRSSTAYFTLFSKGPVFSDQALFWCWAQMDQGVCTAWQKAILSDALLLYSHFLLWKDTNFSPLWTKDSRCVLIFEFFPSKDVFQGGCSTVNFMVE